jgi:tetratricopeptide (TPR) repeat protein
VVPPSTKKTDDATSEQTASYPQPGQPGGGPSGDAADTRSDPAQAAPGGPAPTAEFASQDDLHAAFGDRFELGEQLGQGGFGSVYRALDRRLNRAVALKVSPAVTADADKLLREARALAQLRHEGIVAVYDVAVAGRSCFVVSELLPGPSLAKWLEDQGQLPSPVEAVRIAAAVADALGHAHSKSIVHRDVKPSNIVFGERFRPVLVDFGLALTALDAAAERGVVSGTPSFMSPEQAGGRGHRPDGRTDIYGLAATLYAMLCGRAPFRGRSHVDVLRQVCEDEPQPPRQIRPDMPPELERVCLKGMAKLPGDRYTTAFDFAEALRRSVGLLPALAPQSQSPPPLPVPAGSPAVAPPAPPVTRTPRTERRQVTLLQCALEAPGGEDDPMEKVTQFQAVCTEVVGAHGGLPLQASGTTFLACFGFPVAREDAPRQAVRAALAICQRSDPPPAVAVGTGAAVVTQQPNTAPVVVGDVVIVTAALLAQGTQSGVLVTDATAHLIEGYFDCEPGGEVRPRGAAPVPVFTVRAERAVRNRIEAADPTRLTPLVGRSREVELLRERWDLTAEGVQNVILLVADPGLGKSRLVRVLRDHVQQGREAGASGLDSTRSQVAGVTVIEWYCSPYHQGSPFFPVIEYFNRVYHLNREPDPAARLNRLITRLREDGIHAPEDQALFAAMLSVPATDRLPPLALTPERQREKTQHAVLDWLNARAEGAPVLFVVEDLHWVDPSTEALLSQFVEGGGSVRVLAVFTFRPEYDPPWKGKAVQTQVALNRLTRTQVAEMIRAQCAERVIPQTVVDQIAERTDGVPLFVEEFTRLLTERGSTDEVAATIPATLQDLLLARLDRMASNKAVVQLGAVIGRTFAHNVIQAASPLDEVTLGTELDKLVGAGLLFIKGTAPRCTYTFKHALIQDAAYQSMVKKQRQQFHRSVAEKLEQEFPDVPATQPELLARHFTEAGITERAVDYWQKAGQRARERSAYREAIRHLERGLELIATLPESGARDLQELQFQLPLGTVTTQGLGWGSPGLEAIHLRARELCERIGPDAPKFHVTWGQWAWYFLRGDLEHANNLVDDISEQARCLDDGYVMEASFPVCCTALFRGEFERNVSHGPVGLALYDPQKSRFHAGLTGQNAFCTVAALHSWALAISGYPEQALAMAERSIRLARELKDPFSEEFGLYHLGCVQQHCRLGSEARKSGETTVSIAHEQGMAVWNALGTLCRGAGLVTEGADIEQGLAVLVQGMELYRATGAGVSLSNYFAARAEGHRHMKRPEAARSAIEEGLAMARNGEKFQVSRLYHIRGQLLLDEGDRVGAEEQFRLAIDTARDQKARSFELRATTSLARLWAGQGKRAEAHAVLAAIYGWFTEGHLFPDLVEARKLLNELA